MLVNIQIDKLKSNVFKKWICMTVGLLIGLVLAPLTMTIMTKLGLSFYSRKGLDDLLWHYYGDLDFNDIAAKELLITSYEFNSKTPRFFSKSFIRESPIYDIPLRYAVGASSSAPLYFDPLEMPSDSTPFNITYTLVDGGIICNNPAFYAYLVATHFAAPHNGFDANLLRMVSLGTGVPKDDPSTDKESGNSFNKFKSASLLFDFMMNIESESAVAILSAFMNQNFVRMEVNTKASLATIGDYWYRIMETDGETMYTDPIS